MYQRNYGVAMVINKRIRFVDIQFKYIFRSIPVHFPAAY